MLKLRPFRRTDFHTSVKTYVVRIIQNNFSDQCSYLWEGYQLRKAQINLEFIVNCSHNFVVPKFLNFCLATKSLKFSRIYQQCQLSFNRGHSKSTSLAKYHFLVPPLPHVTFCHLFLHSLLTNYGMTQEDFFYIWLLKGISRCIKEEKSSEIAVLTYTCTHFTHRYRGINKSCWQNSGIIILWMW